MPRLRRKVHEIDHEVGKVTGKGCSKVTRAESAHVPPPRIDCFFGRSDPLRCPPFDEK
jgi:hypothetical protein